MSQPDRQRAIRESMFDGMAEEARRRGWAFLLRSSADGTRGRQTVSELVSIDIVEPEAYESTRRRQLLAGRLVASVPIRGGDRHEAALRLAKSIAR
jgi:hypothetical protein